MQRNAIGRESVNILLTRHVQWCFYLHSPKETFLQRYWEPWFGWNRTYILILWCNIYLCGVLLVYLWHLVRTGAGVLFVKRNFSKFRGNFAKFRIRISRNFEYSSRFSCTFQEWIDHTEEHMLLYCWIYEQKVYCCGRRGEKKMLELCWTSFIQVFLQNPKTKTLGSFTLRHSLPNRLF